MGRSGLLRIRGRFLSIALVGVGLLLGASTARANDVYIAQAAAGAANGADCADALAYTYFNTSGNWTSGTPTGIQIGPGTTVHLCGTFTGTAGGNELSAQGSGTTGNPITIVFESGADLTAPYWGGAGAISLGGYSYITVNGGTNGIIEDTQNGSGLAYHNGSVGVNFAGNNIVIENLTIRNLYVHNSMSDTAVDQTQVQCLHFTGSNISIHNNVMHDAGWCLFEPNATGAGNVSIYNNTIYNIDHGWAVMFGSAGGSFGPFSFYSNQVYGYANWDTTADAYHHDGVHCFTTASGNAAHITSLSIYNNLFSGTTGTYVTGDVFLEGGTGSSATPCDDSTSNNYIYNNVLTTGQGTGDGLLALYAGNSYVYNNAIIGPGSAGSICISIGSITNNAVIENNAITGCDTDTTFNSSVMTGTATYNYNQYGSGGSNAFTCNGNVYTTSQFASWQSCISGDANSAYSASLGLNTDGSPQSGSPVIGAAANLTSLGITALDSDTTDGNTRTPTARPSTGNWDTGAFNSGSSSTTAPNPPTNLTEVTH